MNIQIGVIVTQILGFLIVFWLLRKFAWGPILNLLEERRETIRRKFEDIETEKARVEELKARYEADLKQIDAQARQRINEALTQAQKMAADIEANARQRAEAQLEKMKADIEREYQAARVRLKEEIVNVALGSAERMVKESLDRDRQRKLVENVLSEIEAAGARRRG